MDCTTATWRFINSFAPWLSALGTLAAVVTSLHLAQRDRNIRLVVRAGQRRTGPIGTPIKEMKEVVTIEVTNVGHRTATINCLYWRVGKRSKYMLEMPIFELPKKLKDGDQEFFRFPMEKFLADNSDKFKTPSRKIFWPFKRKDIFVGTLTTSGDSFEFKIEKPLQKTILSATAK